MRKLTRVSSVSVLILILSSAVNAQDRTKNYKELDQDGLKLFNEGKYEESRAIWGYIQRDYPRTEFRELNNRDPRFIAWQNAFHISIVRAGFAKKQAQLQSPDPALRATAETAYTRGIENAKEMMSRVGVTKAAQEKLITVAAQPLHDALKKIGQKK